MAYRWLEPDQLREARLEAILKDAPATHPVVVMADGSVVMAPKPEELSERLGLHTKATRKFYDVVVIGAGPAGLACALYCSTEGLKTVMVEREAAGGQAGLSSRIENYLGFPSGLSGADLARRGVAQVKRFGTEVLAPARTVGLSVDGEYRVVTLADGQELAAHSVVLAAGVQWRRLAVPEMDRLAGAGILLRGADDIGSFVQGRGYLHDRGGKFGRAGDGAFCGGGAVGDDDYSGGGVIEIDVALSGAAD